jgi:tetratricopeptide (TPR) repeat protein
MAQNRHEEAIVEAEQSLALNPSNIDAYLPLGIANVFLCRPEQSIEAADKAIRLSPRDFELWAFYQIKGEDFFIMQQDANTIEWVRRSLALAPHADPYALLLLISSLALSNHGTDASDALKRYLSSSAQNKSISQFQKQQPSLADNPKWLAYNVRFAEGLRLAGMPE